MKIINPPPMNIGQQNTINRNAATLKLSVADANRSKINLLENNSSVSLSEKVQNKNNPFVDNAQLQGGLVYERPKPNLTAILNSTKQSTRNTETLNANESISVSFRAQLDNVTDRPQVNPTTNSPASRALGGTYPINDSIPLAVQSYQSTAALLQRQEVSQLVGIDVLA
jgi:hypothetical protein